MDDLLVISVTAAKEQAQLRDLLVSISKGNGIVAACKETGIDFSTAKKRMGQYPEIMSEFKKANDALMRSQLLAITNAKDTVIEKLTEKVKNTNHVGTLMAIDDHLTAEADRIKVALNTDGSSRDDEVKRIMGLKRRPMQSRMEITITLDGTNINSEENQGPQVIDGKVT